jgi:hypothetical protein
MKHMSGLAMVTDQLKAVARHSDWSSHAAHMNDVDAELAELNQQIKIVVSLRDFVGEMDDLLFRKITAGEIAPLTEGNELLGQAMELFALVCNEILPSAEDFARQGFPVAGISRIREIAANPSAGLMMAEIARTAAQMTAPDGSILESPIDPAIFDAATEKGKLFRHLGNE